MKDLDKAERPNFHERQLLRRMQDPEFRAEYEKAREDIEQLTEFMKHKIEEDEL